MTEPPTAGAGPQRLSVNAHPTKNFFVEMLIRDVDLLDSVVDLVDNSVDGARRLRGPRGRYDGLKVELDFDHRHFSIRDNCGGISLAIARDYAFRFGREDVDPRSGSHDGEIGQFGVGMKRTLFKLGWYFKVVSQTTADAFVLEQDVQEWRRSADWEFEMLADTDTANNLNDTGTTITVTNLRASTSEDFRNNVWEARLRADVRTKHRRALDKGMVVTVNGNRLEPMPLGLHESDDLKPIARNIELDGEVHVRLLAGVSTSTRADAGWYVFLNDRLVIGPDRTALTVWEGGGSAVRGGGVAYHDQFARFRGFALLESASSAALPWTSTKTGVDVDSAVWRRTRQLMQELTRPVINFLNQLDREKTYLAGDARAGLEGVTGGPDGDLAALVIANRIDDRAPVDLAQVKGASNFLHPEVSLAHLPPQQTWIRFRVPTGDLSSATDIVRDATGVESPPNGDVGLYAFDYLLRYEGGS